MEVDEDGANDDPLDIEVDMYTEDDIVAKDQFIDEYLARIHDNTLAKFKEEPSRTRRSIYLLFF
jgi:hypothetical protein